MIKTAQRLGFTLDEIADLLDTTRPGRQDRGDGLRARAAAKVATIDAKIADLYLIRTILVAALKAGCEDLVACAASPRCPLPFTDTPIGDSA